MNRPSPARVRRGKAARSLGVAATALAVLLGAGACSVPGDQSADGASATGGTAAGPKKVADLKIAYFSAGTSNAYLQAAIAAGKKKASALGVRLDVFDGQFDAQKQFDQIQTALTSGKYNAFAVEPNDGNLVCKLLTQQAPRKGILVSVFNLPICGRATKLGEETWQPGTVTYVGGQTLDVYEKWVAQVVKDHPDGARIALISGPDLNANTLCFQQAAKAFATHKGFKVVAQQATDYTTPKGNSAAQTILRANPDLDVIMSNFSGMSRGIVQAVNSAGRKGKVKIYDFGGDTWALNSVRKGDLQQSVMMLPAQETEEALQALADHVSGKPVPHFINLTESSELPGTPFATASTVDDFTPEY
ncbi:MULTISPECIES: sugar ABC transporter substrate-binding protein [Streptomyces]|uniref:Sugar ABC transporter substrate-binding protein n=1 Tax=Streptomyces doudnae TaxID=3075536 RepID=A0ABD5F102_9ACTN|nr:MULTISPECIES: sugar ABC transporter substrate-binding protein [unclassified Streptomyces]MDT0440578.1 sugar ABC transporter substrate-binding protein [Streptomyces sp. DSM 41981]MYQ64870.1 substrate-binding domain-containing protein [Streptomyces sp. SID4950]SCD87882.1 monosaccharide ABC transporter substrate-binding protein, CUT2 family [Streptomyces sp. SolWspMP-5a-2]